MSRRASGAPMELWPINVRRARENLPFFTEKIAAWLSFLLLLARFRLFSHFLALSYRL
jgi:hypothetical protein